MRQDRVSGSDDRTDRHQDQPGDRIENIDLSGWRQTYNFGSLGLWSRDVLLLQLIASVMISRGWLKSEDRQRFVSTQAFRDQVTLEFVSGEPVTVGQIVKDPEQLPHNVGFVYSNDVRIQAIYWDSDGNVYQVQKRKARSAGVRTPIVSFTDAEEFSFARNFGCLMEGFAELQKKLRAAASACVPPIEKPVLVLSGPVFGPANDLLIDAPVAIQTEGQMQVLLKWLRLAEAAALDEDDDRQNLAVRYENAFLHGLDQAEFEIPSLPEESDN